MLLEPRFTAETFADFLNIPKNRNLLRKHLRHKFLELLNRSQQQQKSQIHSRDIISPITKFKPKKVKQYLISNKFEKYDELTLDLVCPRQLMIVSQNHRKSESSVSNYKNKNTKNLVDNVSQISIGSFLEGFGIQENFSNQKFQ